MKTIAKILYFSAALALLSACGDHSEHEVETDPVDTPATETATEETDQNESAEAEDSAMEETATDDAANANSALDAYSSEQIEYARVWLQLGPNQDIDGLYVNKISAGTPLNPDDETSAAYPEDVIQLAGSRLVDGSVTYSGNGDGTINVYNVPLRWDGEYPAGEEFYTDIIESTEMVAVDVGDDEKVLRLIELLEIES